jgi:hypothetical protein
MQPKNLMLCCLAVGLHAQPDPGDLLHRVTTKVLETVDRLPKYMCTLTIDRSQYEPPTGLTRHSCEPDARRQLRLTTSDRLRLDVAASAGQEMYSWVGESRFEDRSLFQLVGSGALSTGSFASFLMLVFRDDEASFSYQGEILEAGQRLAEFEFSVPVQSSHYIFAGPGNRITTGYFGSIFVDPHTADLLRLVVHTDALPAETGSCESSSTLDYSRVRLNGADFLLPSRVQLHIRDASGMDMENTTVFSACHEFLGESTLRFDSEADIGATTPAQSAAAGLPAGVAFGIAWSNDIDQTAAAAGDKLAAKVTTAIKDKNGAVLVPKGAAVIARIVQIRRFYAPQPSLRLVLKLETVDVGGTPRPLAARPDARAPVLGSARDAANGALRSGTPLVTTRLDNRDPEAAVFVFWEAKGNLVGSAGVESRWLTAAR